MTFGGPEFENNVPNYLGTERAGQIKGTAFEKHIMETQGRCRKSNARNRLTGLDQQRQMKGSPSKYFPLPLLFARQRSELVSTQVDGDRRCTRATLQLLLASWSSSNARRL